MSPLKTASPLERTLRGDEPFHALGTIQPHGILVVAADGLTIECISENVETLLGLPALDLCGAPLAAIVDSTDAGRFTSALRETRLAALNPYDLTLAGTNGRRVPVQCTVHRCDGGRSIIEFEPSAAIEPPSYGEATGPIERLTGAPDSASLLAVACSDIRTISGFERVMIYRFDSDWQSQVVAESTTPGMRPVSIGRRYPASHIPESLRHLHLQTALRMVPDTHHNPARIVAADPRTSTAPVDLSRASLCGISSEHLGYLIEMGSRAAITISLIIRRRLWGIIAVHNDQPRHLGFRKRAVCELIGHMLAWQLDSRLEKERLREHARATTLMAQIGGTIETQDDLGAALLQTATPLMSLFAADGIAVCINAAIRRHGRVPGSDATLLETAAQLNARAVNGVASAHPAGGELLIRLSHDGSDFVLVSRDASRPTEGGWTSGDIEAARNLRTRLETHVQLRERSRLGPLKQSDPYAAGRSAQAAALVSLHEELASAMPSRAAMANVVLEFAQRETNADGCVMETLTEAEILSEAATGSLAACAGSRLARAGSLSDAAVTGRTPLLCADSARDVQAAERAACQRMGIVSMALVPIELSEETTIVLKAVSGQHRAFDDEDIQTLKLAATNLVIGLRAAQKMAALGAAEQEQRTYAQRLRALHAIASTTTSNRKDQIDAALRLGLEQLDLDWAFLGVVDYSAQQFIVENSISRDSPRVVDSGTRVPLDATIVGRVVRSKGVRVLQDVSALDERPAFPGWSAFIAAPLFIGDVNYGTVGFTSREIRTQPFSEANIEFVAVLGELISSALERGLQRERLQTSESRYRALTDAIPALVWVVDAADRFEYVNARWMNYTGLNLEQSRARGWHAICDPAHVERLTAGRSASPVVENDCEVRLRRADGVYRWHLVCSVPFDAAAGNAEQWLVTATDIEERKSAEALTANVHDATVAATAAKSRFLATMSHEIRTPMNAVMGMTELLLLTQLSDDQREYVEIVRDSGQSLLHVLNDILDYSKIEAGKLELESVHFDLAGQIESVVELLRAQYQIKGVRLTTKIGAGVPAMVAGDPGRLRQILLNLAGNALKFTPAGGNVHVDVAAAAQDDPGRIRFSVEDTGIGIPADIIGRLFQPFSQGDQSTTRKYGGTGLGLSICAQLVALMNGTIGVQSVAGQGSTFWFEILLRGAKNARRNQEGRKRGSARSKPVVARTEKILLVEDNEINTMLALKQLQRIGFAVSAVSDGRQAVETVSREHFDLVFMDCQMPEMDGFEATREIRRLELDANRHVPIVAMTAGARTEDHQNCLRAGMDDYVTKPTSLESLRLVLDRWLPSADRRRNTRNGAARTNPAPTLRVAKLLELFSGDRAAVIALLAAAATSIKTDFARIEMCAAAREFAAAAEAAHRLTGTSASIRSPVLGEIAAAVERAALTATTSLPEALLVELRAAVVMLIADVERHSKVLTTIG